MWPDRPCSRRSRAARVCRYRRAASPPVSRSSWPGSAQLPPLMHCGFAEQAIRKRAARKPASEVQPTAVADATPAASSLYGSVRRTPGPANSEPPSSVPLRFYAHGMEGTGEATIGGSPTSSLGPASEISSCAARGGTSGLVGRRSPAPRFPPRRTRSGLSSGLDSTATPSRNSRRSVDSSHSCD